MRVLIVESTNDLALLWSRYLARQGVQVTVSTRAEQAIELICDTPFDVIVLDLVLAEGSALAVADFAQYRQPETNVIFVTDTTFFWRRWLPTMGVQPRRFVAPAWPRGRVAYDSRYPVRLARCGAD